MRQQELERAATQSPTEWWRVLEVAPGATKEEIVRNYRRKIQQCHPDRVAGLAPEFLELAEEHSKALNAAYAAYRSPNKVLRNEDKRSSSKLVPLEALRATGPVAATVAPEASPSSPGAKKDDGLADHVGWASHRGGL